MKSANFLWLLPIIFPLYFAFLWVTITFLISRMGWNRLREFVVRPETIAHPPTGRSFGMNGARIGMANYNNCLTVIVAANGLYMRPIVLFKLFHPPLLIPWSAFSDYRTKKVLWATVVEYTISTPQGNRINLLFNSKTLGDAIEATRSENPQSPFSNSTF